MDKEAGVDEEADGEPRKGDEPEIGPVKFVRDVLKEEPYEKQIEILEAVQRRRRVSVVGCNGSGKDWTAARVVLWWVNAYSPAKAIVTGPTTRQVSDIVWREMQSAHAGAGDGLKGEDVQDVAVRGGFRDVRAGLRD